MEKDVQEEEQEQTEEVERELDAPQDAPQTLCYEVPPTQTQESVEDSDEQLRTEVVCVIVVLG